MFFIKKLFYTSLTDSKNSLKIGQYQLLRIFNLISSFSSYPAQQPEEKGGGEVVTSHRK